MDNQKVDYIGIREAAQMLDINPATLRRWDKKGFFKAERHLGSKYRFYNKELVQQLINKLEQEARDKGIKIMKKDSKD